MFGRFLVWLTEDILGLSVEGSKLVVLIIITVILAVEL